jgi:trehalose 6-phosphate synthase
VLWPVFHNRLDLAQFEARFFERFVDVNRCLTGLLQPMLRPDDVIWVHDYHLIPFAAELRKRGVGNPIGFFLHIPFPPWQTFMAVSEHKELARALAAYDLIGLQTTADVANLINYMMSALHGRIEPDGRIRLFDQLVSIASFPIGIDPTNFAKAKRASDLVQVASTGSTTPRVRRTNLRRSVSSLISIRNISVRSCLRKLRRLPGKPSRPTPISAMSWKASQALSTGG